MIPAREGGRGSRGRGSGVRGSRGRGKSGMFRRVAETIETHIHCCDPEMSLPQLSEDIVKLIFGKEPDQLGRRLEDQKAFCGTIRSRIQVLSNKIGLITRKKSPQKISLIKQRTQSSLQLADHESSQERLQKKMTKRLLLVERHLLNKPVFSYKLAVQRLMEIVRCGVNTPLSTISVYDVDIVMLLVDIHRELYSDSRALQFVPKTPFRIVSGAEENIKFSELCSVVLQITDSSVEDVSLIGAMCNLVNALVNMANKKLPPDQPLDENLVNTMKFVLTAVADKEKLFVNSRYRVGELFCYISELLEMPASFGLPVSLLHESGNPYRHILSLCLYSRFNFDGKFTEILCSLLFGFESLSLFELVASDAIDKLRFLSTILSALSDQGDNLSYLRGESAQAYRYNIKRWIHGCIDGIAGSGLHAYNDVVKAVLLAAVDDDMFSSGQYLTKLCDFFQGCSEIVESGSSRIASILDDAPDQDKAMLSKMLKMHLYRCFPCPRHDFEFVELAFDKDLLVYVANKDNPIAMLQAYPKLLSFFTDLDPRKGDESLVVRMYGESIPERRVPIAVCYAQDHLQDMISFFERHETNSINRPVCVVDLDKTLSPYGGEIPLEEIQKCVKDPDCPFSAFFFITNSLIERFSLSKQLAVRDLLSESAVPVIGPLSIGWGIQKPQLLSALFDQYSDHFDPSLTTKMYLVDDRAFEYYCDRERSSSSSSSSSLLPKQMQTESLLITSIQSFLEDCSLEKDVLDSALSRIYHECGVSWMPDEDVKPLIELSFFSGKCALLAKTLLDESSLDDILESFCCLLEKSWIEINTGPGIQFRANLTPTMITVTPSVFPSLATSLSQQFAGIQLADKYNAPSPSHRGP